MATIQSLLEELTPELGQVQHRTRSWVCNVCMGPVSGFATCYACGQLRGSGALASLLDAVVPVSIATNPGRWYNRLSTYKAGNPSYRAHLAALTWSYIERHEEKLAEIAGGAIDVVTPVPSKRGRTFADQPLQQALAVVKPIQARLADTLRFVPAEGVNLRRDYYPECFDPGPGRVNGGRVLLIEDSWVTGATAISAAGALLGRGAKSVVTLPLARIVDVAFWAGRDHPYLPRILATSETRDAFDISAWLR